MEIYLDNSATTRVLPEVKDLVVRAMTEDYGNPSSMHRKGVEAEQYVRRAREQIAATLKASEREIFFTSGGTESDNWALVGGAMANRRKGRHIITTAIEHPAVIQPLMLLKELGFDVTFLPVDGHGLVDPAAVAEALREDTILVSVMYVNNEVGAMEPVEEIGRIVKAFDPSILFHVDAVQAYGKTEVIPRRIRADLISVSGHKIHAPKGTGFLYVREKTKIRPIILGGGQQGGMRSGTDNVPGIAGLGLAASIACADIEAKAGQMRALRDRLAAGIADIPDVRINSGSGEQSAPHILNASFTGIRSEVLLHALEDKGISVSAGSACSTNKKLPVSPVLKELGLEKKHLESALRFSFSTLNTEQEVDETVRVLHELVPVLRRYTRH